MLNTLLLAILGLAAALVLLYAALCLAIRGEDRGPRLTVRPPSAAAALVRRIAGLSVRRTVGTTDSQPDPRLALSGSARPSETDPEGR